MTDDRKSEARTKRLIAEACDGSAETLAYFIKKSINYSELEDNCGLLYNALLFENVEVAKYLLSPKSLVAVNDESCKNCLHLAVALGEVDIVEMLIKKGCFINAKSGRRKSTALYDAVLYNNTEIVELLLKHGANVNIADSNGGTPLHIAVKTGNSELVHILLCNGASVYATTATDTAPLHVASTTRRSDIVKLLVEEGAWINAKTIDQVTPLHLACKTGSREIAEFFLLNGAEIDAKTTTEWLPLHFAVHTGGEEVTDLLLDYNCYTDAEADLYGTPLHIAVRKSDIRLVELLLRKGASPNVISYKLGTPLWAAIDVGNKDIAARLISHGANNFSVGAEHKPLHTAAVKGRKDLVDLLLRTGTSVNDSQPIDFTPMWSAAEKGSKEIIEYLLSRGGNLNEDSSYFAPLTAAAKNGRKDIAEFLLRRGACVNVGLKSDPHPLHFAVEAGCKDTVEVLLRHGADINAGAPDKQTPLHIACKGDNIKIVEMLLSLGANINAMSKECGTPLHAAASKGNEKLVELLLSRGANVNARSESLGTPLHAATARGSENIVKLFIGRGAKLNVESGKYGTALHTAALYPQYLDQVLHWSKIVRATKRRAHGKNSSKAVEMLLRKGASVKVKSVGLGYPLQVAACGGYCDIVDLLLEYGADINAVNADYGKDAAQEYKGTALCVAVLKERLNVVKVLLKHNPDVNNAINAEALRIAVHCNDDEYDDIVECLLNSGFSLSTEDARNPDVLRIAFRNSRVKLVEEMFKMCFKENESALSTMLGDAAGSGGFPIIATLLKLGVDVNRTDLNGMTAMHYVARNKKNDNSNEQVDHTVQWLLKRGAKLNVRDRGGRTPLHSAATHGVTEMIEILLDNGANIHDVEGEGYTALDMVLLSTSEIPDTDVIQTTKYLLSRGANVNSRSNEGFSPLHHAFYCSSVVELLLENGADVNAVNDQGYTALHLAALNSSLHNDAVLYKNIINSSRILLGRGADVNVRAKDGTTPLHIACKFGDVELVALLVEHSYWLPPPCHRSGSMSSSAERLNRAINAPAKHGKTPLHYAAEISLLSRYSNDVDIPYFTADIYEVNNMLLKKGALVNKVTDDDQSTAFHLAVKSHDKRLVPLYLKLGANIDARDKYGNTPLHIACQFDKHANVEALLHYGADYNATNHQGGTPLYSARKGGLKAVTDNSHIESTQAFLSLLRHIVKMKAAGMYVSDKNLQYLKPEVCEQYHAWYYPSETEFPVYETYCQREIGSLKTERTHNSGYSFFDVLSAPLSRLILLTRDKTVISITSSTKIDYFKKKFPIYSKVILGNLARGKDRGDLQEKCTTVFRRIYNTLPDVCIENIVRYLHNSDMRMLLKAYPLPNNIITSNRVTNFQPAFLFRKFCMNHVRPSPYLVPAFPLTPLR